jgi:hypothetical protein
VVSICAVVQMLAPCDLSITFKSDATIKNPERLRSQRELSMN